MPERVASTVREDYQTQRWLRVPEAALVAGCSKQTIYHHMRKLKTRRTLGGGKEIDHAELLRYLGRS